MGWEQTNHAGATHQIYRQEGAKDCGPACVLMVHHALRGETTSETLVKAWFSQDERKGLSPDRRGAAQERVFKWNDSPRGAGGAFINTIKSVIFNKLGYTTNLVGPPVALADAARCSVATPGVLFMKPLAGVLGHFVVCAGVVNNDVVVLDPERGLQLVPGTIPPGGGFAFPAYLVGGNPLGVFAQALVP